MARREERPSTRPHRRPSRREFLGTLAGAVAFAPQVLAMQKPGPAGVPVRPLGRADATVSIVGYGGWDCPIAENETEAIARMHLAIDEGITFFDNAWEYHEGRAEEVMGKALAASSWRDRVFLMTKVCARDYAGVKQQIDESLKRLRTDRVDLLQFHAIQYADDPERIFDPEKGGLKAALEARTAGKVRFLGFSGHRDPQTHARMIRMPHDVGHGADAAQHPRRALQVVREHRAPAVPAEGHRRSRDEVARRAGRAAAARPEDRLGAVPALRHVAAGRHDDLRDAEPRGAPRHGAHRARLQAADRGGRRARSSTARRRPRSRPRSRSTRTRRAGTAAPTRTRC